MQHTERPNVAELYRFTRGVQTWNYTNNAFDLVSDGVTYSAVAISRSKITKSVENSSNQVTITAPQYLDYSSQYFFMQASGATAVTIWEIDIVTGFKRVLWQGRAVNVTFGMVDCKVRCETMLTALSNALESPTFQANCPWEFCDPHSCRKNRNDLEEKVIVSQQSGNMITVSGLIAHHPYTGGLVRVNQSGEQIDYFISEATGAGPEQSFRLDIVPPEIVGKQISVYIGCDHTLSTCRSLGNVANYGGFPWMPKLCPMDGSLVF